MDVFVFVLEVSVSFWLALLLCLLVICACENASDSPCFLVVVAVGVAFITYVNVGYIYMCGADIADFILHRVCSSGLSDFCWGGQNSD